MAPVMTVMAPVVAAVVRRRAVVLRVVLHGHRRSRRRGGRRRELGAGHADGEQGDQGKSGCSHVLVPPGKRPVEG